jgi:phosphate transport system substrate-binding protein
MNKNDKTLKEKLFMRRTFVALFAVIALLSMVLSACAPAAPSVSLPATVEVTRMVAGTPQTVVITATPAPVETQPTPLPEGSVTLNGAGATFPLPVYTEWTYAYQYVDPSVILNYQGIGSGGGKKGILDGTIDFAGSDSVLTDAEYTSGKDLQMYPALAGAVVNIYNIKFNAATVGANTPTPAPLPALVLDGKTLVGIYNGIVKTWNDPAIVALNPALKDSLPNAKITVVHRSDGSGTTEIFTNALTSFSTDWKAGAGSSVQWPVDVAGNGLGGKGNPGVAAVVQNTPNSIGYVELSYAIANNIPYAQMVNKAGKTVKANAQSLASAINDFGGAFTDKLTAKIVNGGSAGTWPIAGYTYLILHTTRMTDCVKAQKLLEYIRWTLTDPAAAKRASDLGYTVLSGTVQKSVLDKLAQVTCSGNPVLK